MASSIKQQKVHLFSTKKKVREIAISLAAIFLSVRCWKDDSIKKFSLPPPPPNSRAPSSSARLYPEYTEVPDMWGGKAAEDDDDYYDEEDDEDGGRGALQVQPM